MIAVRRAFLVVEQKKNPVVTDGLPDPNDASRTSFTPMVVSATGEIKDMPMLDGLKWISTAFGLLAATAAVTQAQTPAPGYNQATANAVAAASGVRITNLPVTAEKVRRGLSS